MRKTKLVSLPPDDVKIGWRARTDLGDIAGLVSSISQLGQLQPIVVKNGGAEYEVIAGVRRLMACRKLGRKVLAMVIDDTSELENIDRQLAENLKRKDFDKLELGRGLKRRKPLYEKEHPESRVGATGGAGKAKRTKADFPDRGKSAPAASFVDATAASLGVGKTVIYDCMALADLPRKELKKIEGAKTTGERNKIAANALRTVRQTRKTKKLEDRAEKARKEREEASELAEPMIVLKMMDNREYFKAAQPATFDIIWTDPPYNRSKSMISHTLRSSIDTDFGAWDKLDVGWVVEAARLLVPGGQWLICCPLEAIGLYEAVLESIGHAYRGAVIWHKTNPGVVHRNTYLSSCEAIVWATNGNGYFFLPWDNAGSIDVHNHFDAPICAGNERTAHPTQKPEAVVDRFLDRHAQAGARVLDPFAGSGTTLVCCKRRGLQAVGIESSPEFVHLARLRLEAEG